MKVVTDNITAEKTVKRLLTRIAKQPIEVYLNYNTGLTLPNDAHVSIIAPISEILPLCKFDEKSDFFASISVYDVGAVVPLFEISWKKSGKYLYKNNRKFENPPLFDELFNATRDIYKENLADLIRNNAKNVKAEILFYRCHTLILKRLKAEQVKG